MERHNRTFVKTIADHGGMVTNGHFRLRARECRLPFLAPRNISIKAVAVRNRRPSRPAGPTSCTPKGRPPFPASSGSERDGKPLKVHKVQNTGSPVEPNPFGATPGAAGVMMAS